MKVFRVRFDTGEKLNGKKTKARFEIDVVVVVEDNKTGINAIADAKVILDSVSTRIETEDGSGTVKFNYTDSNPIGLELIATTGIQG